MAAGAALLDFLRELQATTTWTVEVTDGSRQWQLNGATWQATVNVDPGNWLGLEFESADPVRDRSVIYEIDSDLYDISREDQQEFVTEIERDIIEFLDNLRKGLVLRGNYRSKPVLVFPLDGSFVRVVQGLFVTTSSVHADLASARVGGGYVPVES